MNTADITGAGAGAVAGTAEVMMTKREVVRWEEVTKVIVAVHGIGDQFRSATIQSVVNQVCSHQSKPAAVPLGLFSGKTDDDPPLLWGHDLFTDWKEVAFAEVYWADVPREVQQKGYTLEEAKAWARTIVERLRERVCQSRAARLKATQTATLSAEERRQKECSTRQTDLRQKLDAKRLAKPSGGDEDEREWQHEQAQLQSELAALEEEERGRWLAEDRSFKLIKQVLREMIESLAVLGRLSYLADRAGLFTFDLRKLLDSYLGDVQIVTEFRWRREAILKRFSALMETIQDRCPEADIYIVAHSEGTVVAFLSLLQAAGEKTAAQPPDQPGAAAKWIDRVRGFMTLGSPIDKHLILWPKLWANYERGAKHAAPSRWGPKIEWRNYYDFGDPVGFDLNEAREWLAAHGWDKVFAFSDQDDFGFSRYPLPGKAHVDYWTDEGVFGHFIETVVGLPSPKDPPTIAARVQKTTDELCRQAADAVPALPARIKEALKKQADRRLKSKWGAKLTSYVFPYAGVYALLCVAVYVLYKALVACIAPGDPDEALTRGSLPGFLNQLSQFFASSLIPRGTGAEERLTGRVLGDWQTVLPVVLANALLLLAVTVAASVPRLTALWRYRALGYIIPALLSGLYLLALNPAMFQDYIGWGGVTVFLFAVIAAAWLGRQRFGQQSSLGLTPLLVVGGLAALYVIGLTLRLWMSDTESVVGAKRLMVALSLSLAVGLISHFKPNWSLKIMLVCGLLAVGLIVFVAVKSYPEHASVWPVLLALGLFFYLWWLAALIFDLVFVWHLYIRHSVALDRMSKLTHSLAAGKPRQAAVT
jgi:hypothetical protein